MRPRNAQTLQSMPGANDSREIQACSATAESYPKWFAHSSVTNFDASLNSFSVFCKSMM